jgi:hypothetical protein
MECAFPNRLAPLAAVAGHLTPDLVLRERDKLPLDVPVLIYHVKPPFALEIMDELARLAADVAVVEQDKTYTI